MTTTMMEDFIDDYINLNDRNNSVETSNRSDIEDIVTVEEVGEVEAIPFVLDSVKDFSCSRDSSSFSSSESNFLEQVRKTLDEHLQESSALLALKYEVDNNKILIQDIKGSVVSLKVSTSRIERDIKDLSVTIGKYGCEKKQLDSSLVDLEFRFNELVAIQEEADTNNNNSVCNTSDIDRGEKQDHIKEIIEQIEGKIQLLDAKIANIDVQNSAINSLATDIKRNEEVVRYIQETLNGHQNDLIKLEELQSFLAFNRNNAEKIPQKSLNQVDQALELKVNEFIMKTETNERSIATAWVGLIAALLLIPIAYFLGKFL